MTLSIFMPKTHIPTPTPLGTLIEEARERNKFRSQSEAARESKRLGIKDSELYEEFSQQWLSNIEKILSLSDLDGVGRAKLRSLEKITGLNLGAGLNDSKDDPMAHLRTKPNWTKLPRIGVVNAGNSDVYELAPIGEYDEIPERQLIRKQCKLENCYTYLVNGDSMVSDGTKTHQKAIAHGDIIVIERFRTVQKDDLVVFWDKAEQKMLVKAVNEGSDDGYMVFRSFNSSFPPIVRHESDVKIYGVVVWRGG
jgi:SOS-response transcriptional repressor LexA